MANKPGAMIGTTETPWNLKTPPGTSEFQAWRDATLDPPALVVQVGTTQLRYHLRCIDDLHAMLKNHGDWMPLGSADEQKPAADGTVEAWGRAASNDLIRSRVKVKSLNFMRGRTFLNKLLIIDEAQNLTPKQMKTLITRAGPGTKVVCLGNIAQIDTPYLSEGSSGLTYVVDRFKGWAHGGHVTLQRGERSRLADYAAEIL